MCVAVAVAVAVAVGVAVGVAVYVYVYVGGGGGWWWAKSGDTLVEASRDTNAQIVRYTFFQGSEKTSRTISRLVLPMFLQDNWSLTALLGKANDWRNREHVVLDLFSNLNMGNIQWFLSVNLWGQVITLRA